MLFLISPHRLASQLPVLCLQLSDALMRRSQRLVDAALPLLFCFKLADPAPDGTFAKLHVFTDLANAQALGFDLLSDLALEAGVKGSSRFLGVHCCRH